MPALYMEAEIEIGDVYMFKKLFGQLQRIGKALMLPVAIYQQLVFY